MKQQNLLGENGLGEVPIRSGQPFVHNGDFRPQQQQCLEEVFIDTNFDDRVNQKHPDWIKKRGMLINKNLKEKYTVGNNLPILSEDKIEQDMNDHSRNKNANGLWYAKHNPCGIQDCNKRKKQPALYSWLIDFECEHEFTTLQYRDQPNPDHLYYINFRHCKKCGRNRNWWNKTHDEHTQNLLFKFDDMGCMTEYSKLDSSALSGGYSMKWNGHEENPLFESYKSEEEYVEHEKERIRQAELEGHGYTNITLNIKITRNYKTRKHGMESYF